MVQGVLITFVLYLFFLFLITFWTRRRGTNADFFLAGRATPWWIVSIGMLGDSISGVTFVSVPGMVQQMDMSYMQLVLGFFFGYIVIAYVLLPLYYRLQLVSIYTYLEQRFGRHSYRTGALFFIISKLFGAAAKLFLITLILQQLVFAPIGVPYVVTVLGVVGIIWLYTQRGGMGTIIWTDVLQTVCLVLTLGLIVYVVSGQLGLNLSGIVGLVGEDPHSRVFFFDDWTSPQYFWKQFVSGIFIVIVMTGLDQDMMQKNLTCKTLREAQKDMCSYGFAFAPVNLLFLALGILLMMYYQRVGQALPAVSDDLMLQVIAGGQLGTWVVILFTIGIVAACFSSADSALTALTTTFCVDICNQRKDERLRKWSHLGVSVVFVLFILIFRYVNSTSLIDAVYTIVSYTYGPLLGLFAFGLSTKRKVNDRYVPFIAIASPLLCFALDMIVSNATGYKFGYELLMLNGLLTYVGLWLNKAHLLSNK